LINVGLGKYISVPENLLKAVANLSVAVWNLILAAIASVYCDKAGRRPLFLTSTVGMLCSYVVVMGLSAGFANTQNRALGIAVIPFLFMQVLL